MAQNVMRVNSISDRYVTETMIGLNLNLNEEIDFDFFDNFEKPDEVNSKEEQASVNDTYSSLDSGEDDDDVQVSPTIFHQDSIDNGSNSHLVTVATNKENDSSSDSVQAQLSTNTENAIDSFDGSINPAKSDNVDNYGGVNENCGNNGPMSLISEVNETVSLQIKALQGQTTSQEATDDCKISSNFEEIPVKPLCGLKSPLDCSMTESLDQKIIEEPEYMSDLITPDLIYSSKEYGDSCSLPSQDGAMSCKTNETHESGDGNDIEDSDEGCPFEGSDSEELLLAVHTLTIIPRDRDGMSFCEEKISHLEDKFKTEAQRIISSEKANITARSSSGYSSASYKTHGHTASEKAGSSKSNVREQSSIKISTPDMDEFIKSFRSLQPASPAVSFSSCHKKLSSKGPSRKRQRKNMSFSNEEMQRIERENAILLNKIVLQQRARPPVVHSYERRVCSNAINRARQLKRIENDNEILLRKIQDVKRRSSSCSTSRCTSQASSSQF